MAQHGFGDLESPTSGAELINGELEPSFAAIYSNHKGGTRPDYITEGGVWVDDTTNPWVVYMLQGGIDVPLGTLDTSTHKFTADAAVSAFFTSADGEVTTTPGATTTVVIDETVPSNFTLAYGTTLVFVADQANYGATTINVKGTGASPAVKFDATSMTGFGELQVGDLIPGYSYFCFYDGTNWQIVNVIPKPVPAEKGSNFTATFAQFEAPIVATADITITLSSTATYADYYTFEIFALGGAVTLSPDAGDSINGKTAGSSVIIPRGASARIQTDAAGKWYVYNIAPPVVLGWAISDETTAITTGNAKITDRMPFGFRCFMVKANLNTASSSGTPTFDINKNGTTTLSTKLTIDANEKTSVTAASAAVISVTDWAADDEITIDIDVAGTGAKGAKIWMIGRIA